MPECIIDSCSLKQGLKGNVYTSKGDNLNMNCGCNASHDGLVLKDKNALFRNEYFSYITSPYLEVIHLARKSLPYGKSSLVLIMIVNSAGTVSSHLKCSENLIRDRNTEWLEIVILSEFRKNMTFCGAYFSS